MKIIETPIKDLLIIEPRVFKDDRGYFYESYNQKSFQEFGINTNFVQDNQSFSKQGTIRGLHFQTGEHSQAKLVRATLGTVLDVAVDLRAGSPTFGQSYSVELSEENKRMFYVPRGFAHGFSVLSEVAVFAYKCDNFYNKESEGGIKYNDPKLKIDWKVPTDQALVSPKDLELGSIDDYSNGI